jgi:predicted ribosome quality control (RQC) complex YloA/Tae2 family protein
MQGEMYCPAIGGPFMLSMSELRRAVRILETFLPGSVLKRIVQADPFSLVLFFRGPDKKKTGILLSCNTEYARLCAAGEPVADVSSKASFYEYIRAHLNGAVLSGIDISGQNRQVKFLLNSGSDSWMLLLSILGVRSNVYLVDARGRLIHSMRPLEETRRDLRTGGLWTDPEGSVPSMGEDRWSGIPDRDYLDAVCKAYGELELRRNAEELARRIKQALNKERTLLGRKLTRLCEDLADARLAETYREKGELLKSVLHTIKPGDDSVTATDYKTGETATIPIDPNLSPAANLEAYFARYHKDARGEKMIRRQILRLQGSQSELEKIESVLDPILEKDPPDAGVLEEIAALPLVRRLIGRYAPGRKKEASRPKSKAESEIPSRLRPKRYRTGDDLEIWVGKNDEGNDYLTTRMARGNDLFFHLEGYPGSHVVLRTEGRTDPPSDSVLDACELAVHFSKMKNARSADVHIAPIKYVKKPRGAKPGLVYVRQGRTIHLRRDPGRLQNILASRCDE